MGRFSFEERTHGAGGFARVIRGKDNELERDVAVKVLDPLATKFDEKDRERFRREARILAKLSHPNIPAIYDVEFSEERFLIIFQFVDGTNLAKIIAEEGPCDLSRVRIWFGQIASALEHAHGLGIVHRDVKPENIIVTANQQAAYLVDFGIALTADDAHRLTDSGFAIGTPGYMSPEQQAGEEIDFKTDIYSLGVTMYEALSGKQIPVGAYEDLSTANEAIPPQIDDLIQDCVVTRRDKRLGSIKELSTRLSGALRPLRPLSEVLAHGRLHELADAIEDLTAEEFARLPDGQRALILLKLSDIVGSGDPALVYACARFLELLVPRGILLGACEYDDIVKAGVEWGFKREVYGHLGREGIRRELESAAHNARAEAHAVLRNNFATFLRGEILKDKEDWYLHSVRQMLQTLLANPTCAEGTAELATLLKEVNRMQRSRR